MLAWNSIKFKIGFLYTIVLAVLLVSYSAFLYLTLAYSLNHELDTELAGKAAEITAIAEKYSLAVQAIDIAEYIPLKKAIGMDVDVPETKKILHIDSFWNKRLDKLNIKQDFICLWKSDKTLALSSKNITEPILKLFKEQFRKRNILQTVIVNKRKIRTKLYPFNYNNETYLLQIGSSLKPIMDILGNRIRYISYSIPFLLGISILIGYFFARTLIKPMLSVTQIATGITHQDLSKRIPEEEMDVEMKELVMAFNSMISRLETSFSHIGEFSSNVAHELKTPLAIMQGECEVSLRKERDAEEYKKVMHIILEEIQRMRKTIEDLLLLSKIDYQPLIFKSEKINLIDLVREVSEQAKLLGQNKSINVFLNEHKDISSFYVQGDAVSLRRVFLNIIDNAIKFTPVRGEIKIDLSLNKSSLVIEIRDNGIGIDQKDLPHVFERFFQKNKNKEDNNLSNGLGLSIAKAIAIRHNALLSIENNMGAGCCVRFCIAGI